MKGYIKKSILVILLIIILVLALGFKVQNFYTDNIKEYKYSIDTISKDGDNFKISYLKKYDDIVKVTVPVKDIQMSMEESLPHGYVVEKDREHICEVSLFNKFKIYSIKEYIKDDNSYYLNFNELNL